MGKKGVCASSAATSISVTIQCVAPTLTNPQHIITYL